MDDAPPTCPTCKYDLTGLGISGTCPECGQIFDKSRLGFRNQLNRFEAKVARLRTIVLVTLTVGTMALGALLQFTIWDQGLATALLIGLVLGMAALWSYLTEKPAIIEPSNIEPPDPKRKKSWFSRNTKNYDSPGEKHEDHFPLPKD